MRFFLLECRYAEAACPDLFLKLAYLRRLWVWVVTFIGRACRVSRIALQRERPKLELDGDFDTPHREHCKSTKSELFFHPQKGQKE